MKLLKFCTTFGVAAGMLFIASCNPGDEKKTDETTATTDSTAAKAEPTPPPPAKPANVLLVWHKVANFDKWLPLYESHDSTRQVYGLHNYIIARSIKDPSMVMVALYMDDADKAKQFAALPDLKAAMQKGGVVGTPKFSYLDVQLLDSSTNSSTTRVMRMGKVKDWDTWKKAWDSGKHFRADAGLADRAVGYSVGDNHSITVVYAVSDQKKAEDHFKSKEMKERMAASGVEGTPETFWYTVAKKY